MQAAPLDSTIALRTFGDLWASHPKSRLARVIYRNAATAGSWTGTISAVEMKTWTGRSKADVTARSAHRDETGAKSTPADSAEWIDRDRPLNPWAVFGLCRLETPGGFCHRAIDSVPSEGR